MPALTQLQQLCTDLGCAFLPEELLSQHTSFKVGGACRALIPICSVEALQAIHRWLEDNAVRYTVLGKGSNIIAADTGFDGVVLQLSTAFSAITQQDDTTLCCDAGASLKQVCMFALEHCLHGMEFAYGIPGSVGGALYMNAGAYGGEMKDVVLSAEYLDASGSIQTIAASELELAYRHSFFATHPGLIVRVTLRLAPGAQADIRDAMDECMRKRKEKQPLEFPSAGSTFKRPEGAYAAKLIEDCGLKGYAVGGAEVSTKHSGFVINKGGATSADILALTEKVRTIVQAKTGYVLELEPILLK